MTTMPYISDPPRTRKIHHLDGRLIVHRQTNGKSLPPFSTTPGQQLMTADLWQRVAQQADLTDRERMVCRLLFEGKTRDKIAEQLSLKPRTVRQHLENIHTKLNVHHRVDVVLRIVQLRDRILQENGKSAQSSDINGHSKE